MILLRISRPQSGDAVHFVLLPQADGTTDRQWQPVRSDPGVRLPVVQTRGAGPQSQPHHGAPGGYRTATEPASV